MHTYTYMLIIYGDGKRDSATISVARHMTETMTSGVLTPNMSPIQSHHITPHLGRERFYTPSPPIKSLGFRGFVSSRLLNLRGGNSHVCRI